MKKEVIIGILALAAVVIAGCTQVQESTPRQVPGVTYPGVLDMLNDAEVAYFLPDTTVSQECDNVCIDLVRVCIDAYHEYWSGPSNILEPIECNQPITVGPANGALYCRCASP